jgi:UDP-N-acetylglucosamine 2-epimerase
LAEPGIVHEKKKVVSIVGARPQFIKEAALSPRLRERFDEVLVHTGQHYDVELSRMQFDILNIPEPDYDLEVGSDTHARQTAKILVAIEDVLTLEQPDLVVIYGDTNSTLAGALASAKLKIPVAHVEAGPRQHDLTVPEEINRVVADRLSSLLFAPTDEAVGNLAREGLTRGVFMTGDVMYDIFLQAEQQAAHRGDRLAELGLEPGGYVLLTLHRPHNSDDRESLDSILSGVTSNGEKVLFPAHPRTVNNIERHGLLEKMESNDDVIMIKPVDYMDMVVFMKNARVIVTDSGGVNKEAYFARKPCICVDFISAWPQLVEAGWCVVTGSDRAKISEELRSFDPTGRERPAFFGDGSACERIARTIDDYLSGAGSEAPGPAIRQEE